MDSVALLVQALSRPIQLSVSLEDSQRLCEAEAAVKRLEGDYAQLMHRWTCCASVLSQIREYCKSHDVALPPALAFVTPWE